MPMGPRELLATVGLGLMALAGGIAAPGQALAQSPSGRLTAPATPQSDAAIPTKNQSFRIPFNIDPRDRGRLKEVQLYFSVDSGQSWHLASSITPDRGSFTFRAPRDAEYWFAVRTIDDRGLPYPPDDAKFDGPDMRVVVDTTPPGLQITSKGRRGSVAGVRWEMRDEHLDPKSLVIQYQTEGARDWREVPIHDRRLIGEELWDAGTAAPLLVQAWVDDTAGNRALTTLRLEDGIAAVSTPSVDDVRNFEQPPEIAPIRSVSRLDTPSGFTTTAPSGGDFGRSPGDDRDFYTTGPAAAAPSSHDPRDPATTDPDSVRSLLVKSPAFELQYAVEDAGPDGPALVELWITRDGGQTWSRQPEDADRHSPYPVNLGGEGTYGLWLVVQAASGLGDRPPRPGDRPQMWVEVDSQPPALQLFPPRIGTGPNLGKVLITWQASDPHLAKKPVMISYLADDPNDTQWHPVAERLDNTGSYIWTVPPDAPARFHLRVDVIDSVGNTSYVETTPNGPILVDRSRPRGRILGLDPGNQTGPTAPNGGDRVWMIRAHRRVRCCVPSPLESWRMTGDRQSQRLVSLSWREYAEARLGPSSRWQRGASR